MTVTFYLQTLQNKYEQISKSYTKISLKNSHFDQKIFLRLLVLDSKAKLPKVLIKLLTFIRSLIA